MTLAYDLHHGQVDKLGVPYIYHPMWVASQMETEDEVILALLHDVLENNCGFIPERLLRYDMDQKTIDRIEIITHPNELVYQEYIDNIIAYGDKTVIKVKLSDIAHNLEHDRRQLLPTPDTFVKRYEIAQQKLRKAYIEIVQ